MVKHDIRSGQAHCCSEQRYCYPFADVACTLAASQPQRHWCNAGWQGNNLIGTVGDTDIRAMIKLKNFTFMASPYVDSSATTGVERRASLQSPCSPHITVWRLLQRLRPTMPDRLVNVTPSTQLSALPRIFDREGATCFAIRSFTSLPTIPFCPTERSLFLSFFLSLLSLSIPLFCPI